MGDLVGLKLVLVLVSVRLTMTQRLMRIQKWEKFRNSVDLAVQLWFYENYIKDLLSKPPKEGKVVWLYKSNELTPG